MICPYKIFDKLHKLNSCDNNHNLKETKGLPYVYKLMNIKTVLLTILILLFTSSYSLGFDFDGEVSFKGYITNKKFIPIKLRIFQINNTEDSFFTERNLEDNSYTPYVNLKLVCENDSDYLLVLNNKERILIPFNTKLEGYISEIIPPKSFNRKGFYKVNFDKAICPDGQIINLKNNILSKSESSIYNPLKHLGKTTLNLLGGSLAGTLLSYELGGLGFALATHGYSLAAGALGGGFVGIVSGLAGNGKDVKIEPGDELSIVPVNEESLSGLKQIICNKTTEENLKDFTRPENLEIEVLSVKQKKDVFGETCLKINVKFTNKSGDYYRLSNFFLKDSQGKEYTASFFDLDKDIFSDFPPNQTKVTVLDFYVDHPKASHWLVLKDKNFSEELGVWRVN